MKLWFSPSPVSGFERSLPPAVQVTLVDPKYRENAARAPAPPGRGRDPTARPTAGPLPAAPRLPGPARHRPPTTGLFQTRPLPSQTGGRTERFPIRLIRGPLRRAANSGHATRVQADVRRALDAFPQGCDAGTTALIPTPTRGSP